MSRIGNIAARIAVGAIVCVPVGLIAQIVIETTPAQTWLQGFVVGAATLGALQVVNRFWNGSDHA